MSTRSRIGIYENGKVMSIYCHWDGYLSGVGKMLLDYFQSEQKIRDLIALGDISTIGKDVENTEGLKWDTDGHPVLDGTHSEFAYYDTDFCVAYHRDWGRDFCQNVDNFDEIKQKYLESWIDFFYLWKDGKWWCTSCWDLNEDFRELTDTIIEEELNDGEIRAEKM